MSWRYVFTQSIRLFCSFRLQTILLVLCYACGIIIPMSIISYRQGVMYVRDYNIDGIRYDYSVIQEVVVGPPLSAEVFQRLTDYREIREMLEAVGDGAQMSFISSDMAETAIYIDGQIIRGRVVWQLPVDDEGYVFDRLISSYAGNRLSPDTPYEIMLGDGLLRGIRRPETMIGKELVLYGNTYVVCGIAKGVDYIIGNMLSRSNIIMPILDFKVSERSDTVYRRLSEELEDRFSITGLRDLRVGDSGSDSYTAELNRQINNLLIISLLGFGFCIINSFGIINSLLSENKKVVYTKLTVGAGIREIFTELLLFWCLIVLAGSLLAFGAVFGVREYMALYLHHKLVIGWRLALLLPPIGLASAAIVSFYSVSRVARRLA